METPRLRLGIVGGGVVSSNGDGYIYRQGTDQRVWMLDMPQMELSALFGIQAHAPSRVPLLVRLQYQHGLSSTSKGETARNRSLALMAGVTLLRW